MVPPSRSKANDINETFSGNGIRKRVAANIKVAAKPIDLYIHRLIECFSDLIGRMCVQCLTLVVFKNHNNHITLEKNIAFSFFKR